MMKERSFSWKRLFLTILAVILGIIFTALIAVTIVVNALLNKIPRVDKIQATLSDAQIESIANETDPDLPEGTYETLDPEEIDKNQTDADVIEKQAHIINILLIGQDRRGGTHNERSDTMILVTVNLELKTMTLTSFMRDLYVDLPDHNGKSYADNRLNACYAFGGMEMLDTALKNNFGVLVDHNIEVDFNGFTKIIDIMGGVDIFLSGAEAYHLGGGLVSGMNHLDGETALNYARIRSIDSDFNRTARQRTVMLALFEKIRYMNMEQLTRVVESVLPMATTDMTNADIIGYAADIFPILTQLEVKTQRIPADGTFQGGFVRGMSVLLPDMEANRQLLRDTIG